MSENKLEFKAVLRFYERGMYQESFDAAKSLAESGDIDAQVFLGWLYLSNYTEQANEIEALRWYETAAAKGSTDAQYALGNYFKAKKEYQQAFEWYKRAGDNLHLTSLYNLGLLYEFGLGVDKNEGQAMRYFEVAASKGHLFSKKKIATRLIKSNNVLMKLKGFLMYPAMLFSAVWLVLHSRYDERTFE